MNNSIAFPTSSADLRVQARDFVTDASQWIQDHWLNILVATAVAVGVFFLLHFVRGWGMRLCRKGEGVANWYSIIGRAVARTGNFFIVMTAIRLVKGFAGAPPVVETIIHFLFTIAAVFQGAVWAREIILGMVEHRTRGEDPAVGLSSALGIIRLLTTLTLFAIALVMVLSNLGVNVTGLVAGLGVGGIAIGLAAQGIFGDLIAALSIIFDRPFRLGDTIKFGASEGVVEGIGLKSTRLRMPTGEERIVSNRKLLDNEIVNASNRIRNRIKYGFTIGYDTPPETVERLPALMREAVEEQGYKLVHGGVNGFNENGIACDVEYESEGMDFPAGVHDRVIAAILKRLRGAGIAFAYRTQVNLVSPNPVEAAAPPPAED
ncbi:mechanosensitive ion channel domain-containing protein [Sphingomonas sp.]|uniref:mechanosensitive ion channel family protein n=1 Tax=Sphingomonas sp. TaxID=28214 RepID=UPI001B25E7E2|nr:mechanosensitive ion channel domain-containing protein [Sphingomonas sp.]MBO9711396.1 mechanosensitive ion channel [Sphingomonas sp.]